jgi:hypothetical protein
MIARRLTVRQQAPSLASLLLATTYGRYCHEVLTPATPTGACAARLSGLMNASRPREWCLNMAPRDSRVGLLAITAVSVSSSKVVGVGGHAAAGEDVEADERRISVHSSCCSARTAPTRRMRAVRSGKIPTTSVCLLIWRLSRTCGVGGPDLPPDLAGEAGQGQDVVACRVQVRGDLESRTRSNLGADGVGVRLVVDGVQQGPDPAPCGPGGDGHQVRGIVGAAPLPGSAAPMASVRPRWASEVIRPTPDRPRTVRSRTTPASWPVLGGGDLQARISR